MAASAAFSREEVAEGGDAGLDIFINLVGSTASCAALRLSSRQLKREAGGDLSADSSEPGDVRAARGDNADDAGRDGLALAEEEPLVGTEEDVTAAETATELVVVGAAEEEEVVCCTTIGFCALFASNKVLKDTIVPPDEDDAPPLFCTVEVAEGKEGNENGQDPAKAVSALL